MKTSLYTMKPPLFQPPEMRTPLYTVYFGHRVTPILRSLKCVPCVLALIELHSLK